jgi:hypothetical protein
MITTTSREILNHLIEDYLIDNLGCFLIYLPELGIDDTPTVLEYERRRDLTMSEAINYEIGKYSLNGYSRYIFRREEIDLKRTNSLTSITIKPFFQAVGDYMEPFTHICLARGLSSGTITNGNNRGNPIGSLILTKPVPTNILPSIPGRFDIPTGSLALYLANGTRYETDISLVISTKNML